MIFCRQDRNAAVGFAVIFVLSRRDVLRQRRLAGNSYINR